MIIEDQTAVTPAVLQAMAGADNPRLKEIMESLVRHLHAFAREVHLTEEEFDAGIEFLIGLGQKTTATHNEAILFSDAIGFSTLVCLQNSGNGRTESLAALLGPFWRATAPEAANGDDIVRSPTPGPALFVSGRVLDPEGKPVEGAIVDVWHASPVGLYENEDPGQTDMNLRGKFRTDAEGRYEFRSVMPAGYPVPTHGPVGKLLAAQNRHPYRPAHVHFMVVAPGYKTLVTQVFVADDPNLDSDVVFGVTRPLIGDYRRHDDGTPPAPDVALPWYTLERDFTLEPGESKLPHPPIA